MTRAHNLSLTLAALASLGLAAAHPAQASTLVSYTGTTTITDTGSATAFTHGTSDVYDLGYTNTTSGIETGYANYTNNNAAGSTKYGVEQYFTTGANALGYTLKNLTLKSNAGYGGITSSSTFTVYFGTATPSTAGHGAVTFVDSFTAPAAPITPTTAVADFFTVDLSAANLQLNPNSVYAFAFGNGDNTGNYYFGTTVSSATIPGAAAIYGVPTYGPPYTSAVDHTFDVGLTAITAPAAPEPSQVGMLALMGLGLGGLLLRARRRASVTA